MHLICNLIRQDVPTVNGRVYSKEALERIVELSNQQSADRRCLLFADSSPDPSSLRLADTVGLVLHALVEDGRMHVETEILDTPKGQLFKEAAKHPEAFRVSVCPVLLGNTIESTAWVFRGRMKVDPASLSFRGWILARP